MSYKKLIGCLTIGQSPRPDMLDELRRMTPGCTLLEMGALDGLSEADLAQVAPAPGEDFYVTRLRGGQEIKASKARLSVLVQAKLKQMEAAGVMAAALLCTGEFPKTEGSVPVLQASDVIKRGVQRVYRGKRIAVVIPDEGQRSLMSARWSKMGIEHEIHACLPYFVTEQSRALCRLLQQADVDFIVLDCIGFPLAMAEAFREGTEKNVLLPREMIGKAMASLGEAGAEGAFNPA